MICGKYLTQCLTHNMCSINIEYILIVVVVVAVMLGEQLGPRNNFLTSNPVLFQLCKCFLKCQTYITVGCKLILIVMHFNNF